LPQFILPSVRPEAQRNVGNPLFTKSDQVVPASREAIAEVF
jgi:hypothetical protein